MTQKYNIAIVPGDGIGHEIIPAGVGVLEAAAARFGFALATETFPYGAGYYKETGAFLPNDALDTLKQFDAIYFGAVGLPDVDDTLPAKLFMPNTYREVILAPTLIAAERECLLPSRTVGLATVRQA